MVRCKKKTTYCIYLHDCRKAAFWTDLIHGNYQIQVLVHVIIFDIGNGINFAEKGVAHHVPLLFAGTLNEILARKVKLQQSLMWGWGSTAAIPAHAPWPMNYINIMLPKYQRPPVLSLSKGRPWQPKNIEPKWWRSGRAMNMCNQPTCTFYI